MVLNDGYLVAERLGRDEGDLLDDPLVGVEVKGQLGVIFFNNDTSCLLNSFGPYTSHDEELEGLKVYEFFKTIFLKNYVKIAKAVQSSLNLELE